jgi:hypothetical protein
MNKKELMAEAVKQWGQDSQLDMVIEECSELIKAICKYKRGSDTGIHDILEERVDVGLMLEQIDVMFPSPGYIEMITEQKLQRLENLLKAVKK